MTCGAGRARDRDTRRREVDVVNCQTTARRRPARSRRRRTDLTEEQRAALQAFAEIDVDGDGELTADEIYRALSKNDADVSLEHVKELVAKADTDGNGTVNRQEYLAAVAADVMPTIVVDAVPMASSTSSPRSPEPKRPARAAAARAGASSRPGRAGSGAASCRISRRTT